MIKKIINWLFPDWEVFDVIQAKWLTSNDIIYSYVVYEILYSKRFSKYKLKCSGIDWVKHPKYPEVIKRLNQLNSEHTSNSKEVR